MKNITSAKVFLLVLSVLSIISLFAFRFGWHFELAGVKINLGLTMIFPFVSFLLLLFCLMRKWSIKLRVICFVFVLLGILANILFFVTRPDDLGIYARLLLESMYVVIPTFVSVIFLFIIGYKSSMGSALKAVLCSLVFIVSAVLLYSLYPIGFSTLPVVYDYGDSYAVVWTTNVAGKGWLEVNNNNTSEIIYHMSDGKRVADTKIHRVIIRKEQLNSSTYKVYTQRLLFQSSNKVVFGRTIASREISFEGYQEQDEIKFLSLSDYHSMPKRAEVLAKNAGEFDFLVLNGDMVSFVADSREIEKSILGAAGRITGGRIPVIIARGNHELMSHGTEYLKDYIFTSTSKPYFTFSYGKVYGIVLDAGIDKPDNHYTYNGLADFDSYRKEQTLWLESILKTGEYANYQNVFVICHVPLTSTSDAYGETMKNWTELLNSADIDFSISGHTHKYKISEADGNRKFHSIEDGGKSETKGIEYVGTLVKLNKTGITVDFLDQTGNAIESRSFARGQKGALPERRIQ